MESYCCFEMVFRLITLYPIIMKITRTANPNEYSGMGVAEVTVKGLSTPLPEFGPEKVEYVLRQYDPGPKLFPDPSPFTDAV